MPELPHRLLSRDESLVIKALCITIVVLHNFLHLRGFAAENEFQFYQERADAMWQMLQHPTLSLPLHVASFVVSYALVGFVFVSGYGLVKRYEHRPVDLGRCSFVGAHWFKLVRLLLPAMVLAFVTFYVARGYRPLTWRETGLELSLLANLYYDNISIYPFVYWYLGMALQLYVLYALVLHRRAGSYPWWHQCLLIALVAGCWLMQALSEPTGYPLYFMRVNLVGYVGAFVLGIVSARHLDHISLKPWKWMLVCVMSGVVMVCTLWRYQSWLLGWLPSAVFVVSLVKAAPWLKCRALLWLGGVSASLYVIHPVVREAVNSFGCSHVYADLLVYLVVSLLLAAGYAWLQRHLPGGRTAQCRRA